MTVFLATTLAFLATFVAIFALNAVVTDIRTSERKRLQARMEQHFRARQRDRARNSPLFSRIAIDSLNGPEGKSGLLKRLKFLLEQAGMEITPARLLTISGVLAIVLGVVPGVLLWSVMAALPAMVAGACLPVLYVLYRRRQRTEKLRAQLPDAFDLMSRVLRSGQTISQALQGVSEEFSEPISMEFLYCTEQMNLGLSSEAALRELGRRTGLLEIKIFVLAVVVHRQTGGNLAELLDKLASVVRERFRIRAMVRSLTAQGRLQATILLSLPPAMFVLLMALQREYEMVLLDYPLIILAALGMMGLGALWINKVVHFDY